MKQKRFSILTVALALALTLVLAAGILVACNPTEDPNGEDLGGENGIAAVFSEEQFNAIVGYLYSNVEEYPDAFTYIYFYSADAMQNEFYQVDEVPDGISKDHGVVEAMLTMSTGEEESAQTKSVEMVFLSSAEEAVIAAESLKNQDMGDLFDTESASIRAVGNVAVIESKEGVYEEVMQATVPSSVSQARKAMLKQGYEKMIKAYAGYSYLGIENDQKLNDSSAFVFMPEHGNCMEELAYYACSDEEEIEYNREHWEKEKKFYTDDSYLDFDKEEGYAFESSKAKPGFRYSEITYGDNIGKLSVDEYYSTEDVVEELVIPAKIDGNDVAQVNFSGGDLDIKKIVVPEGVTSVSIYDDVEALTLPSTLKTLTVESDSITALTIPVGANSVSLSCVSLKTVNYAGSTADFSQKYNANSWCHVGGYDQTVHDYVYTNITISVVCNDGTLTYPDGNQD